MALAVPYESATSGAAIIMTYPARHAVFDIKAIRDNPTAFDSGSSPRRVSPHQRFLQQPIRGIDGRPTQFATLKPRPAKDHMRTEDSSAHTADIIGTASPVEIAQLHDRCGIYTTLATASTILDQVGWVASADLSRQRLLEPAAGAGAFVVEAARRLIRSRVNRNLPVHLECLIEQIEAYELHEPVAHIARQRIEDALLGEGLHWRTARALAAAWVIHGDFLLKPLPNSAFTHFVGNPPYVRWSKLPKGLKSSYEARLPKEFVGGDLFLPFLDRGLEMLARGGRVGVVCSDRWKYMAFAEAFRRKWLPRLKIESDITQVAKVAFVKDVDAYASIVVATKCEPRRSIRRIRPEQEKTLEAAGYTIRVGPALGCSAAYVLEPEDDDVEPELLHPWLDGIEIGDGSIGSLGRRIVLMYDDFGLLRTPSHFPRLMKRLRKHKSTLSSRSIVTAGAPWYRPIDRYTASIWKRPKLLVPELAKVPRIALDTSGAIPSHGVYAIFAPDDDLAELLEQLKEGGLAKALEDIAPVVKGGYVRCYKRFLNQMRLKVAIP